MKLLVAGGRDIFLSKVGYEYLDKLHKQYNFDELVNGMANGVDRCAREWAVINKIPIKEFYPDWSLGKMGGVIRNEKMAKHLERGDIVCIFKGSRGSLSMLRLAIQYNILVINLMDEVCYTI